LSAARHHKITNCRHNFKLRAAGDLLTFAVLVLVANNPYVEQAAKRKIYVGKTLPFYLKCLEDLLKQNNGGDGYFVGSNVSEG
jgi:Glutathione S-transferase, C-terminal domain